jgi:hypothetical protein
MSQSACPLCGKIFSSRQRAQYHIDNNVCQKQSHRCPRCERPFSTNAWLKYHLDHNVCQKHKLKLKNTSVVTPNDYTSLSKEQLITKLVQSETEIQLLKSHPQTVNNINNINNINIKVNFGDENIDEILEKSPNMLQDLVVNHISTSIPTLTKKIHCNPEFPQYSNVYIQSYRNPYAMVFQDGNFCRQPKMKTIGQLIDQCVQLLGNHVDGIEDQRIIRKYERYRDSIDEDGESRKELESELIAILIDQGDRLDCNSRLMLENYMKTVKQ